ncbi:MAG: hypothetical protein FWC42_09575 [Proteobacteria bacterium]|nr:hypothetical protein [Pseudomonadota bacterium]
MSALEIRSFREKILNAATSNLEFAAAIKILDDYKNNGWTKDLMYAELMRISESFPSHEDYIYDLMDCVVGFCSPHMKIFD